MGEIINNSCQAFVQLVLASKLPILAHLSIFFVIATLFLIMAKSASVFLRTKRFKHKLENYIPHTKKLSAVLKKLYLVDKTYLLKSDKLFAFCYGIRTPKIYLSSAMVSMADSAELEAVLRHEQYHLQHKDTFTIFIISIIQSVLKFIPGAGILARNIHIDLEIKADLYAVQALGNKKPLLNIIKKILKEPRDNFAFVPAVGAYNTLEPRIYALTRHDFRFKRISYTYIVFSICTLTILLVGILTPVYAHEVYKNKEARITCPEKIQQNVSYPYTPVR